MTSMVVESRLARLAAYILKVPVGERTTVLLDAYAALEKELCAASALTSDAIEIADSCARADIECYCRSRIYADQHRWYDLGSAEPCDAEILAQAVRYLVARGLVLRQPVNADLVRFTA